MILLVTTWPDVFEDLIEAVVLCFIAWLWLRN